MITFDEVRWRNFLSYGNEWTVFKFEKGITSIQGANGFGKSVLEDVLDYVLYNKAYRDIKLSQLVNLKNENNLEVELLFTKNNKQYKVHRTMKMKGVADFFGVFELLQGDVWNLIPQSAHKKDYQKQFEENILGMSRYYFEMIVIKSSLKPLSFISLPKKDRMGFMDNIFSIHLFDHMAKQNKDYLKVLKDDRTLSEHTLDLKQGYLEQQKALISESEKQLAEVFQKQIDDWGKKQQENLVEIETYTKAKAILGKFRVKHDKLKKVYVDCESKIIEKHNEIIRLQTKLTVFTGKMKVFEQYCGDCHKLKEIKKLENVDDDTGTIVLLKSEKKVLEDEKEKVTKEIAELNQYIQKEYEVSSNLHRLNEENTAITAKIHSITIEMHKKVEKPIIKNTEDEILSLVNSLSDLDYNERHEELIKKLIQPLKFYIVRRWMPYFNLTLNEYLYKFGIDVHVVFDEQFKETIKFKNGKNVEYDGLSNGQKKRVALSIMLSLMDLSKKIKNQSYNLLIMDEVIDGLDQEGVTSLLEILKDKTDMELIFIAHNVQLEDSVINRRIKISKEQGFSKFNHIS